ncbi:MAG: S-layer homology domain-containing protein [Peptoniphilus sp.]|nr:S-layer homology domain-containing protein [Peptoniphilus sp.]MDD7363279.1 S-layer homology domain-containing protein [Bacillota bacterium]MDY6045372.1 S-layer homology domain-containing protein [Peptoniphilus sp.]
MMKKLLTAILCVLLCATPVMATSEVSREVGKERTVTVQVDRARGCTEHRGIFIDPLIAGSREVTGVASANVEVVLTNEYGVVLGRGVSDINGRFRIKLSRSVRIGETLTITDSCSKSETSEPSTSLPTSMRHAYIRGYGSFMYPNVYVSRAEVAMMVARIETGKLDIIGRHRTGFSDVRSGWYAPAVDIVSRKGILRGYPDNRFCPFRNMTRAEFVTMLTRMTHEGGRSGHPFTDSAHHWASRNIGIAYNNGWIQGYEDGQFHPNRGVTRAEAVAMLNRVLGRHTNAYSFRDTLYMGRMNTFIDVRPNHWAYYELLDAANDHTIFYKLQKDDTDMWHEVY